MATIKSNLTKLENARVAIIKKTNEVLGTSMKETTLLSEIPNFIEASSGGAIINFDTWNADKIYINWDSFKSFSGTSTTNRGQYILITAEKDGYLSLVISFDSPMEYFYGEIRIKSKSINNYTTPYIWPIAALGYAAKYGSNYRVALSLNTYISKGNTVAILIRIDKSQAGSYFTIAHYGCTFYYK